jgi:hypothetical protein
VALLVAAYRRSRERSHALICRRRARRETDYSGAAMRNRPTWVFVLWVALGACKPSSDGAAPPVQTGTGGTGGVTDYPCRNDEDKDGYCSPYYFELSTKIDCDDFDAQRFPGAPERLNAIDDDCDGMADEGLTAKCPFTVDEPAGGCETATQLVAGPNHACVLTSKQRVRCWGWSEAGQLGLPGLQSSPVPVVVPGVTGAVAVVVGAKETCALVADGAICWGGGVGFPFRVELPAGTKQIAVSGSIFALDGTGQVWRRPFLPGGEAFAPFEAGAVELSSGPTVCARGNGGSLICWNAKLEKTTIASSGVDAVQVSGSGAVCFIRGGELQCTDSVKQAPGPGNGSAVSWAANQTSACAINAAGKMACWFGGPKNVEDAAQLAAGSWFACIRRKSGRVSCFGRSDGGWMGDGRGLAFDAPDPLDVMPGWDKPTASAVVLLGSPPRGLGACDNASSLGALAAAPTLPFDLAKCREDCAKTLDPPACFPTCAKQPPNLSNECYACYTTLAACTGASCYAAFQNCAGFPAASWVLPSRPGPNFGCLGASCQVGKELGQSCLPGECTCVIPPLSETKVCVAPGGCGGKGYVVVGANACFRTCNDVACAPNQTCRAGTMANPTRYCE